ncbi:MAG: hypothetical protein AAF732_20435 [Pseudomonadota bacterium]
MRCDGSGGFPCDWVSGFGFVFDFTTRFVVAGGLPVIDKEIRPRLSTNFESLIFMRFFSALGFCSGGTRVAKDPIGETFTASCANAGLLMHKTEI